MRGCRSLALTVSKVDLDAKCLLAFRQQFSAPELIGGRHEIVPAQPVYGAWLVRRLAACGSPGYRPCRLPWRARSSPARTGGELLWSSVISSFDVSYFSVLGGLYYVTVPGTKNRLAGHWNCCFSGCALWHNGRRRRRLGAVKNPALRVAIVKQAAQASGKNAKDCIAARPGRAASPVANHHEPRCTLSRTLARPQTRLGLRLAASVRVPSGRVVGALGTSVAAPSAMRMGST